MLSDLEKFQLVNRCETIERLSDAIILLADENLMIKGRNKSFNAKQMSENVFLVVKGVISPNFLTREFGIRQQALYLRYYEDLNNTISLLS